MDKVILFDADGVLTVPGEMFSTIYTRSRNLDLGPFDAFFANEWPDFVTGKRDLKEHIAEHPELWQWPGTPDSLLEYWCSIGNTPDDEMIRLVQDIRQSGIRCFLATEQERYRGEYMRDVMFRDVLDGYFISAEVGVKKSDPRFFHIILDRLNDDGYSLSPQDITFFDDSQSKVDAALEAGIDAYLFEGIHTVRNILSR